MWTKADRVSLSVRSRIKAMFELQEEGELTELDDVADNSHDQESHADSL